MHLLFLSNTFEKHMSSISLFLCDIFKVHSTIVLFNKSSISIAPSFSWWFIARELSSSCPLFLLSSGCSTHSGKGRHHNNPPGHRTDSYSWPYPWISSKGSDPNSSVVSTRGSWFHIPFTAGTIQKSSCWAAKVGCEQHSFQCCKSHDPHPSPSHSPIHKCYM